MPTTTGFATDLITFSRGSLATVTDSDGYIKWSHHNLLLASEQLDTSSWTKTSATIAANSIAAPDSAITADTIVASGANGTVLQSYTAVAVPYVFGVWLRRKTGTGNIQIAADNGTYTTVTITNDWALYTVTQTPTAGTKSAGIRIVTSGDEVYAWGAHLYRSDLGGMQANASAYPYYDPSTPKNLLGFTELLTTGWTNTNTTDTQVAIAAPNGSANSIDVAATAGNGTLLASLSLLASPYTFSIWLRRKTGTGTVEITVDGTTYVTAAVTADWQRFSTTLTPTAGTKTPGIRIVTSGDAVYAWGAQLSDSASLDTYVPNFGAAPSAAAAHGPRLDYDAVTLEAKGLLVEEARTNIVLHNSDLTNVAWTATNVTTAKTQTGPDGASNSATLLTATAGNGTVLQAITLSSSARFQSAYVRRVTGTGTIEMTMDNGSTWTAVTVTSGWTRVSIPTQTLANPTVGFRIVTSGDAISVFSVQNENGIFATSIIPTAASTVTRNADVANMGVSQFPYNATEGTLFISATTISTAVNSNRYLGLYVASSPAGNRLLDFHKLSSQYASYKSSDTQTTSFGTWQQSSKIGAAYKTDDYAFVANGGTVVTDTATSGLATANTMPIGHYSNTNQLNGHVRQIIYIPRRMTNAELQARTA